MYFKRLEMHGFKSFAEPVVIDFHEGVTCVVGPNGSGKSNISDAIRWVLGEQSPKMLRGGKMEEVIFAGTANRKSRGMAQVTLVIDNSTGILPIDYNEVAITRRMYRSGEGEYLINNNQCRLRDIRELIMDTGIGVDGYSLIGQGKIADIVSNKPESRREIFEEAAGVVLYKSKKTEAERKLESAQANLERVNDIVSEIEGRIDGLREDSIKAKEYIELRDRFRELEINITLKNVEKFQTANESFKNEVEELSGNLTDLLKEKEEVDLQVRQDRERWEALDQIGSESNRQLLEKAEELNRLTNKSQLDNERLTTIQRDIKRLSQEIDSINLRIEKELNTFSELEKEQEEIKKKRDAEEGTLSEKIEKYNNFVAESTELYQKIEESKDLMMSIQRNISSVQSEVKSMELNRETIQKRRFQIEKEEDETAEASLNTKQESQSADREKAIVAGKLEELKEKLATALSKKAELNEQLGKLFRDSEEYRIKISHLSSRKKTIEEMESNYEGYNGAARFIMKSGIQGIEGLVADLMKVPGGFEVAIETALGGGLQNVVCRKDQNAKDAINLLKTNKAGRLTFLPMESIKRNSVNIPNSVSGVAGFKGMAADIISFDAKYENIFSYLLGRVAVVDNMDNAVALSKMMQGVRVVTLEGEIINASGAVTGGKYKNQTANLLTRKSEINSLAEEIGKLEQKAQDCAQTLRKSEEEKRNLSRDIEQMEASGKALELESYQLDAKIKAFSDSLKLSEETTQKRDRELESIDTELARIEKFTASSKEDIEKLQEQLKNTENQVTALTESSYEFKAKVDGASEEITKARIAKNQWESKLQATGDLLARIKGDIDNYQSQMDSKKEEISQLDKENNSILFSNENVEETYSKAKTEKDELEEYIDKISKEKETVTRELREFEEKQTAFGEKVNGIQDQKYQLEIKIAKNETQLDTMKERLWEEFEISYAQALEYKKSDIALSTAVKESRELKNRIRELGDVNIGSINEYEQVSERYNFLIDQRSDIESARDELKAIIDDMDKTIKKKFKENFDQVVINFEEIFKELFGGGQAELRLDNEDNPLEAGIEIVAQPPGKKLQNINLMSGGEKTMTAIALMFAVLKTKPTPFCILDEVEAALDDSNIDRFAKYLRKFDNIQFTIVTHQKATMEHADVLYGVTMPEQGISKVLSLRLGDDFKL